jgi:hypothetical protein
MRELIVAATFTVAALHGVARAETIVGELTGAAIAPEDGALVVFNPSSLIGKKIMQRCTIGERCKIVGTFSKSEEDEDGYRRIKSLNSATPQAQLPMVQDVLSIHTDLDNMCRGWPGDDPHTGEACDVRLKVAKLLAKLVYCYGPTERGLSAAGWRKCAAGSSYRP